jgi:manganese oxidase
MCVNDPAIWYIMDMGFDTHVAHWHGNNVVMNGITMASVPINPGQMVTATMAASNPGWWQLICHFNTHLSKGMEANYRIYGPEEGACPLPKLPINPTPPKLKFKRKA